MIQWLDLRKNGVVNVFLLGQAGASFIWCCLAADKEQRRLLWLHSKRVLKRLSKIVWHRRKSYYDDYGKTRPDQPSQKKFHNGGWTNDSLSWEHSGKAWDGQKGQKRFMKLAKWTTLTRGAGCHHGIALCLTESGRHQRMKRTMKLVEAHAARFDKIWPCLWYSWKKWKSVQSELKDWKQMDCLNVRFRAFCRLNIGSWTVQDIVDFSCEAWTDEMSSLSCTPFVSQTEIVEIVKFVKIFDASCLIILFAACHHFHFCNICNCWIVTIIGCNWGFAYAVFLVAGIFLQLGRAELCCNDYMVDDRIFPLFSFRLHYEVQGQNYTERSIDFKVRHLGFGHWEHLHRALRVQGLVLACLEAGQSLVLAATQIDKSNKWHKMTKVIASYRIYQQALSDSGETLSQYVTSAHVICHASMHVCVSRWCFASGLSPSQPSYSPLPSRQWFSPMRSAFCMCFIRCSSMLFLCILGQSRHDESDWNNLGTDWNNLQ